MDIRLTPYSDVEIGEFFVIAGNGQSPLYRKERDGTCMEWRFNFVSSGVGTCVQTTTQPKPHQEVVVVEKNSFKWAS